MHQKSVIVAAARTPIGSFQGCLSALSAPELGAHAIREVLKRLSLEVSTIENVIMGCVLTAGLGQAPARQAALLAGLPNTVHALTVNKVCSSGLKSIMLADQIIRAGDAEVIVAGGMESMTNAPYLLPKARGGYRLGDGAIIDSMVYDGLRDAYDGKHMGEHAENCVQKYHFSREELDAFATESYRRAQKAIAEGYFREEIAPLEISQKGNMVRCDNDEEPGRVKLEKIPTLKPVFKKEGTITAANASSLNDGAAAVIVMSEEKAKKMGIKPLARIVAHAEHSQEPSWYTTAPVQAIKALLHKSQLNPQNIDLFEINEAFAAVTMAAVKEFDLSAEKVNVNGGAVALGHPIGASGTRLVTTMLSLLKRHNKKKGIVSLCNGGGEATAMLLERVGA